jgi:hypothetical protein
MTLRAADRPAPRTGPRSTPAAALATLERVEREFGRGSAREKLARLARLEAAALPDPAAVERLHEALCFLRAYPDSREVETRVVRMLETFARRRDLRRFRARLADTGIAGTAIRFRFFHAMAEWLAARWPGRLSLDWGDFEHRERLETFLPLFALGAEIPGLDEYDLGLRGWVRAMKGPAESDAAWLVRRFAALELSDAARERLYDELDPPMTLAPDAFGDPATPSRTLAFHARAPRAFQRRPLSRERPDLRAELSRPPRRVRSVSPAEGAALVDLARAAMVTRSRDLDAFSYGDPRDVRMVDCGGGLAFACIGVRPERRLLLESVYAFLTLKNGVPIGYVLNSALWRSAEIAYNVFDTYRGAEAGRVYGRALAMVAYLFGADSFTIFPFQLGHENEEAIESGAWWFYRKFGFVPRDRATLALMRREEARARRDPAHRSSPATLRRLARENVYYHAEKERDDVIGLVPIPNVGIAATRFLAANWGSDRERAERQCSAEAARILDVACDSAAGDAAGGILTPRGWSHDERLWWRHWAPLVCVLPGVSGWSAGERAALAAVIRLKGARRESDFVRAFDAHARLREAVRAIAVKTKV